MVKCSGLFSGGQEKNTIYISSSKSGQIEFINKAYLFFLQGLDVLEIMRNIHVFVSRYLYNLNNQVMDVSHFCTTLN